MTWDDETVTDAQLIGQVWRTSAGLTLVVCIVQWAAAVSTASGTGMRCEITIDAVEEVEKADTRKNVE